MRLRGLGHLPRVRGREEALPPSEAAVRVGEANTQPSSRVWAAFSARYTNPKAVSRPFLVAGFGGPGHYGRAINNKKTSHKLGCSQSWSVQRQWQ